jgi:NitT/TauT family transport system substrate-binding protein
MGQGDKALSAVVLPRLIPEYLGYYREEGLKGVIVPAGSNAAVLAGLDSGRLEFGQSTAPDQLLRLARGEKLPQVNFFEHIYPFKYNVAVKPGSPLKKLADLKGKRIGLTSFGNSTANVARRLLALIGMDPEKDVTWLVVGEGVSAGVALQRGDVDALVYDDIGFGTLEAAGIQFDYVALPDNLPKIGGTFLYTKPEMIAEHRDWAVGMARAITKGEYFTQQNPEAATCIFLKMVPEAGPPGLSLADQVKALLPSIRERAKLYSPYDASLKWGYMPADEWQDEVKFSGVEGKIKDLDALYTNDLIDEINDFDWGKVADDAKNFKLPCE